MSTPALLRVCLVVAGSAALLVLNALYEELFAPAWQTHELIEISTPSGDFGYGIADNYRVPSAIEVVLRITIALVALIAVAVYVAKLVPSHKVWSGASACLGSALIALMVLQIYMAHRFDVGYVPRATTFAFVAGVSTSIGAAASWAFGAWWPNNSLERTRER